MHSAPSDDGDNGLDLARLQAGFPQFAIWREAGHDRTRYIARSLQIGIHPHTVITSDLRELHTELSCGTSARAAGYPAPAPRSPDSLTASDGVRPSPAEKSSRHVR